MSSPFLKRNAYGHFIRLPDACRTLTHAQLRLISLLRQEFLIVMSEFDIYFKWLIKGVPILLLMSLIGHTTHAQALSNMDFQKIGSRYGVSPYLLLAISIVESQRGELLGKHNVQEVIGSTQLKFLKKIAQHTGRALSEFKGSSAGAMGYMQIIPSTFHQYAQDGDGDGIKDPLNPYDSLATAAYFVALNLALKESTYAALKSYNNSGAYCKKVMALSEKLEGEIQFASRQ